MTYTEVLSDLESAEGRWRLYPEYRDSGIEWLGEIPSHWFLHRLKHLASSERYSFVDGPFGSDLKNEEYQDTGVPLIQLNNIGVGTHLIQNTRYVSEEKANQLERHISRPGDIVIAKMAEPVARAAEVRDDFTKYVIVADCVRFAPNGTLVHVPFLVYTINSPYLRHSAEQVSTGTTRLRINLGQLRNLIVLLPPINEQRAVAAFLDRETAEIDTLIAKKRELIALLHEQRSAIISHAVTKGLNPDVPMKDSGIEWLGEIPAHWDTRKLKYLVGLIGGGTPTKDVAEYWNGDIPWVSPKDMKAEWIDRAEDSITQEGLNESATSLVAPFSVLVVVRSGILKHSLPVAINTVPVTLNQDMKALLPHDDTDPVYLAWLLRGTSKDILALCHQLGATVDSLRMDWFSIVCLPIPPLQEQREITAYLDDRTSRLDGLINKADQTILSLQEYRTALISAAVTGKIDVRREIS
jgi:type I restriction enzyme S subunit